MNPTPLETIAKWIGVDAPAGASTPISHVSTDSRALTAGDLFIALRGPNFDAHDFIPAAAAQGAAAAIVDKNWAGTTGVLPLIRVPDTLTALQTLASAYRKTLSPEVVAITGSNGKTTTKDFTAAVLNVLGHTHKTAGNLNNHIGVPLTLLGLDSSHRAAVVEIGMNHAGEILPLARIAAPRVAIITNIGMAHIENLGSIEAIAAEKGSLLEALPPDGAAILPAEDRFAGEIRSRTAARALFVGTSAGELRASRIRPEPSGTAFHAEYHGVGTDVWIPIPGPHMVTNALLALGAGIACGVPLKEGAARLRDAAVTAGRMQVRTIRGIAVVDDTYNANPDSMIAALRSLALMPARGRHIALLGEMRELGKFSAEGYARVGEEATSLGIGIIAAVGPAAAGIAAAARAAGHRSAVALDSRDEAAAYLREVARPGDVVLIKGSRGAAMERIIAILEGAAP